MQITLFLHIDFLTLVYFQICLLMLVHFIGDFLLQPRKIADIKYKNIYALLLHCFLYTLPFFVFYYFNLCFVIATFCLHFLVDFQSSKLTHKFANEEQWYSFFVTIGFDQLLHILLLLATFRFFEV